MRDLLILLPITLGLVGVFGAGYVFGAIASDRDWEPRLAALRRLLLERVTNDEWRRDIEFVARSIAYARAADAVCLWPARIDKRAELARHLESLATAPELGAATPNPEDDAQVETGSPVSPAASAAPVLAAAVGADEDLGVESGNEGRIDPMEGFL